MGGHGCWKILGLEDIRTSLNGREKCKMPTRQELVPTWGHSPVWSGHRDQQNKRDVFLSVFGVVQFYGP